MGNHSSKTNNILVGGGGFTGVEVAGEFARLVQNQVEKKCLADSVARVVLVEALPTVLPGWDPKLARRASMYLEDLGIRVITGQCVVKAAEDV